MKIAFPNILKSIFGERIIFSNDDHYLSLNTNKSGKYHIYDFYIKINYLVLNKKLENTIILDAYDIYHDSIFSIIDKKFKIKNYTKVYKQLHAKYFNFQYTHDDKYKLTPNENKLRKLIYYNKLRYRLIKYKPKIIKYLNKLSTLVPICKTYPVIYIKRKDYDKYISHVDGGGHRFILNYQLVEQKLHTMFGNNLKIIYPEDYTFLEQFNLFLNAKIVIGQHGSGLVNCVFCNKNSLLVEISGTININSNWFRNQSKMFSQKYLHINQLSMTYQDAIKYFNSITYENDEIKKYVFQELEIFYTTNKYSNVQTIDKMFFPNCISIVLNSGSININDLKKILIK